MRRLRRERRGRARQRLQPRSRRTVSEEGRVWCGRNRGGALTISMDEIMTPNRKLRRGRRQSDLQRFSRLRLLTARGDLNVDTAVCRSSRKDIDL